MKLRSFLAIDKNIFLLLLIVGSYNLQSQTIDQPSKFWQHVRYGGGVGLSFGNGFFSATLAPSAIYDFNSKFAMGLGLTGTYNKSRFNYTSTVLGGSVLALYNPFRVIQGSAEFEELNVNRNYEYQGSNYKDSYWYPALFLGAGYRTGNVTVGLRYDVLYDNEKSIYADPWAPFVRVYF